MNDNENKITKKLPGFYIALCCCVLAIGVAGYFSEKSNLQKKETKNQVASVDTITDTTQNDTILNESTPVSDTVIIEEPTQPQQEIIEEIPQEENMEVNYSSDVSPDFTLNNPDVEETAIIVNAEEPYFNMPSGGEILQGFSKKLKYNEAMGDWRTHNGIDIAADLGCSVSACANGTVEDIFSDVYGEGIAIKHENGFITRYMCLGTVENLNVGDSVKAGDIIGTVGEAKGENIKETHLHLEMYDGDILLNPEQYLN